ncbi:MAG: PDZ domain-containing protein [Campylobacter sp.]|nr:PDZ domain-containing protein [Campylobacter sp.]
MKNFKILALFLSFCVFAFGEPRPTQDDFNACYIKNKASIVSVNGNFGVVITPNFIAVPKNAKTKLHDYVKFDPYLKLYLVRSSVTLTPPELWPDETDDTKIKKSTWVGVLSDSNNTAMGHIKSLGVNLGDFDTLSFDSNVIGELNTACCGMLGIAIGGNKFIPNRYLKHFAAYEDVYYGDIGVSFIQGEKGFFILEVDPIGRGRALQRNDEIVSINGVAPQSLRHINETILFAPKDTFVEFKVKRSGDLYKFYIPVSGETKAVKNLNLDVNTSDANLSQKINVNDLFASVKSDPDADITPQLLSDYGIHIDKDLYVIKIFDDSPAKEFGLKIGDQILQIDKEMVKDRDDLYAKMPKSGSFLLLFTRHDFDFFARVIR